MEGHVLLQRGLAKYMILLQMVLNHLLEKPQAFFAAVWGTLPKLIGNPNRGPLCPLKGAILRFPVNLG